MRIAPALPIIALLVSTLMVGLVCAAPPPDQIAAPGQPFLHPANDVSYSQNMRDDEELVKANPTNTGNAQYISGGIGEGEMSLMESEERAYDLKLLFVVEGKYLADVAVTIKDNKGKGLFAVVAEGPMLLVKLPPGQYSVEAKGPNGSMLTQRVGIKRDHLSSCVLRFPASEL